MSIELQLPNINAPTTEGQVTQLRGYLYQFVEKMKWALDNIESSASGGIAVEASDSSGAATTKKVTTFNELRDLIISNTEIVSAYAGSVKNLFDDKGYYVAQSDFGTYKEERKAILDVSLDGATLLMEKDAAIDEDSDGEYDQTRLYKGCLKIGDVTTKTDGETKYGVSVGQVTVVGGEYIFTSSARFTSTSLDFYDANENRIAYIETDETDGDSKFFIEDAQITSTLTIGSYVIKESQEGLAFIWKGATE